MEILAINRHYVATDEIGNVCLAETFEVEKGGVRTSHITSWANNVEDPGVLHLEDESMTVSTRKRAIDEDSKDLQSPSKKLVVRSCSEALEGSLPFSSSLAEAMVIDTIWEETSEKKESDPKQISGSINFFDPSPEASFHINSGASTICETAQGVLVVQKFDNTSGSVDFNVDIAVIEEDLIAFNSAQLELKGMESIHGFNKSLVLTKEQGDVEKDEEPLILECTPKNSHVISNSDVQFVSSETLQGSAVAGTGIGIPVPDEASTVGVVLQSSLSGVESEKMNVEIPVIDASSTSPKVQSMPVSLNSHDSVHAFQGMRESVIAECATRCETADEAGVDDENGSREVDELQIEKADAAKALELKMVEVIMQSPGFETTESRNGETMNHSSDVPLIIREQEDGNRDLFEPVVQLPKHPEESIGFLPRTLNSEDLSNGQVSDDFHLQYERHVNKQILHGQDPHGAHVALHKDLDFPELSDYDRGVNNVDRQYSLVLSPPVDTSAQSQASGLKLQLKMKELGETATKVSSTFAAGRSFPVKEILLKEAPGSAKLLLASGLLDGHYVRYLGRGGHVMLTGIVQEGGVLCDCNSCKGLQVVNVSAFEKHAGSSARHPSDFIFLENGKCLKDILEIGWNANKQNMNVVDVLKSAIGEIGGKNIKTKNQKYPMMPSQAIEKKPRLYPDTKPRLPLDTRSRVPQDIKPSLLQEVKSKPPLDIKPKIPLEVKSKLPLEIKPKVPLEVKRKLPQEVKSKLLQEVKPCLLQVVKPMLLQEMKPKLPQEMNLMLPQETKPRVTQDIKPRSIVDANAKGSEGRATQPRDRAIREKESSSPPVLCKESSGANLHKALFLPGGLEDDTELGYYVKGQKFLSGVKKGAGILCSCCQQAISCSLFEQHAGWGSRRNPYACIYLADGRSLHDVAQSLVVEQTVKQEGITPTKIEHLDQCVECGDNADLLLCTGCPTAYHQDCLGLSDSAIGDFFCPACQERRFGGTKDRRRSVARKCSKGVAKTLLTSDHVAGRSTRLLQVPEAIVLGGCVFCKSSNFVKSGFGPLTTLLCDQCEREYHVGCLKQHGLEDLKELPEGEWFCGQDCKHIHSILSLLVSNGPEPLADSIISKVLKSQPRLDKADEAADPNISAFEWQLLHGRGGDPSNGKTLAEAVQIFSECFDPIADGRSGGDLIPLMVYKRSIRDQDFGGIYCVVLKQDNKVVSTALIRIFGGQLAELPLLATNPSHQGQGHCKALLLSIERLLGVLRVQRLALPAAEGAEGIWLNKFGFRHMLEDQVQQFHTNLNMMIFTGSIMLEKAITPLEIKAGNRKA